MALRCRIQLEPKACLVSGAGSWPGLRVVLWSRALPRGGGSAPLCSHLKRAGCVEQVLGPSTRERLLPRRVLPPSDPVPVRASGTPRPGRPGAGSDRGLGAPGPVPGPAACEQVLGVSGSPSCPRGVGLSPVCAQSSYEATSAGHSEQPGRPRLCGQLRALWLLLPHRGDRGRPGCRDEPCRSGEGCTLPLAPRGRSLIPRDSVPGPRHSGSFSGCPTEYCSLSQMCLPALTLDFPGTGLQHRGYKVCSETREVGTMLSILTFWVFPGSWLPPWCGSPSVRPPFPRPGSRTAVARCWICVWGEHT